MDKNKIITIIVALIWLAVVYAKFRGFITFTAYRIILLALVAVYALYVYRGRIFGKK